MEKASFLLSKVKNIENNLSDLKISNPTVYYLIFKQVFKIKNVLTFLQQKENQNLDDSFFDNVQFVVEGIESIVLDSSDLENWIRGSKEIEIFFENFATFFEHDPVLAEKIIEIKHILDEVIEISTILSGKIPD